MVPDLKFRIVAQGATAAAFAATRREVAGLKSQLAGLRSTAAGFTGGAGRFLLAGGIAGAVAGIAASTAEMINLADSLVDTADKIGITTTALQELQYQGKLNGASAEEMSDGLTYFSRQLSLAAQKGGDLADILRANGVALRDSEGNLRPVMDLLADYADLIAGAANEQDRARLATVAFGRANDNLALSFANGSAGIRQSAAEFERLGGALDEVRLRELADLKNDWDRVTTEMTIAWQSFVIAVVGGVSDAVKAIRNLPEAFERSQNQTKATMLKDLQRQAADPAFGALPASRKAGILSAIERLKGEVGVTGFEAYDRRINDLPPPAVTGGGGTILPPTEKAAKQTTVAVRELYDELKVARDLTEDWMQSFADGLLNGKSLVDSLTDAAKGLASQLVRMGITSLAGSIFPTPGAAAGLYHAGGVAGSPSASRMVSPLAFAGAPRMHRGGVAGLGPDEVPAILQRGERVLPRGASGGGPVAINIDVTGARGNAEIREMVEAGVREGMREMDRTLHGKVNRINASPRRR